MAQSFFSVNIELNEKRTNRGYSTRFFQADGRSNVAELKDPCSSFFLIFLFATKTGSGKYFTTLRTGIQI